MSFSSVQKQEMITQPPKSACCRRAFLNGVLSAKAEISDNTVLVRLETKEYAEYVAELIKEIYGKETEIFIPKSGGRRVMLAFTSPAAHRQLCAFESFENAFLKKCHFCEGAYLRGIFFAAGRVSDPEKQYSLEFSCGARTGALYDYFLQLGLSPKITKRDIGESVYFRNSTHLEDFFALSAMNNTAFAVMNAKIKNEIRNNVNRIVNCETNNMKKASVASNRVINLIARLIEMDLLSSLPKELEQTARLRYDNRDLSLPQLAALHTPAISKPGLSHRLKRIEEFAMKVIK